MALSISVITPEEVPDLLALIVELAQFERLEHELQGTVESLRQALFASPPLAGALLGRIDGSLAGYALYYFTFCSFATRPGIWLDDLYVRPVFRHRGLGAALIQAVARVGAERNCARFEWIALNWNRNALDFYRKLGAKTLDEWVLLRLESDGIQRLSAISSSS
jgi:GNAT superfamily N-acetyltransferase